MFFANFDSLNTCSSSSGVVTFIPSEETSTNLFLPVRTSSGMIALAGISSFVNLINVSRANPVDLLIIGVVANKLTADSPNVSEAKTDTPPIPSPPVFDVDREELIADMKSKDIGAFNIGTGL